MDEDLFTAWKNEILQLRLSHEAEILHLKAQHRKALQKAQEGPRSLPHYSNWRGDPE
jgi:hypothetical protein